MTITGKIFYQFYKIHFSLTNSFAGMFLTHDNTDIVFTGLDVLYNLLVARRKPVETFVAVFRLFLWLILVFVDLFVDFRYRWWFLNSDSSGSSVSPASIPVIVAPRGSPRPRLRISAVGRGWRPPSDALVILFRLR